MATLVSKTQCPYCKSKNVCKFIHQVETMDEFIINEGMEGAFGSYCDTYQMAPEHSCQYN